MSDAEFAGVGEEFARYLKAYRPHAGLSPTAAHFGSYCRGLLSDEERKTVEPLALRSGTTVRTLQVFLKDGDWDEQGMLGTLRATMAEAIAAEPDPSRLGTIGLIDETSSLKKGTKTPGVQRQYLGCVGKVDNGIVTVHLGVAKGDLKVLLDADLFLPASWDADRERCRAAGIPDAKVHVPKWRLAFGQYARARRSGFRFDWMVFDEGYGSVPPFLRMLHGAKQAYAGEIPVNYRVSAKAGGKRVEVRDLLRPTARKGWKRLVVRHGSGGASVWKYRSLDAYGAGHKQRLVLAVNAETGEAKYFASNAVSKSPKTILRAALSRFPVEHLFRLAKREAGLTHFEGRDYRALMRHMTMVLVVMGFACLHAARLKKRIPR